MADPVMTKYKFKDIVFYGKFTDLRYWDTSKPQRDLIDSFVITEKDYKDFCLGTIAWYPNRKVYLFHPEENKYFDLDYMIDIISFINKLTERKNSDN